MTGISEVEHLVWYCRRCSRACKATPADVKLACKCETPVMPIRPTRITQVAAPTPAVHMHTVSEREAQLRAACRPGKRVRVSFDAVVEQAWLDPAWENGRQVNGKKIVLTITGPGGHTLVIDTSDPTVMVRSIEEADRIRENIRALTGLTDEEIDDLGGLPE
jgi:hypothetical protein